ncbi:unnamed protein product [Paramecium pentaurelia]|uniref:Uncharacterized protein n=1 Tax=Paramecium pentaurelia TaxID=43138 RepID=A0A8S1XQG8_9CILI|nr:unnamed protein product [Paramecium pentaurelia]
MICSNLEIVENNEKLTSKDLVQKMEAYCLEMQQCIESFFMRIDNLLDQIINDSFNSFNQNLEQSQQAMLHQQFILFPSLAIPRFWNQQFGNELIHSISSLLKFSIENQIKKNVEGLNLDNRAIQKENDMLRQRIRIKLEKLFQRISFFNKIQITRQINFRERKNSFGLQNVLLVWICDQPFPKIQFWYMLQRYYLKRLSRINFRDRSWGFKLKVNDIIKITFDLKQQIIKWENLKSNQSQTLTLETNYGLYSCFRLASSKVLLIE